MFELGIAEQDGIVDDGRRWWYISAIFWSATLHVQDAPNRRAALAAFRRDLIDAEVANGRSRREATALARVAGLKVVEGPLTTPAAYEREVGWAWAWKACKFTDLIPSTPATEAEVWPHVEAEDAARIRDGVRRMFLATS